MRLYSDLAYRWYRLLDPVADHAEEAACYQAVLLRGPTLSPETLLELGAGAGNNAFFLKRRFRCTLTDRSTDMLELSRELNPECEHLEGDMRSLRIGTTFDLVFAHDALMYITSEADLRDVAETAFVHTRPGGAAVFAPDCVKESYRENTDLCSEEENGRALRCVEWSWDPDPGDDTFNVDYVFVCREDGEVTVHHDRHVEGLFSRAAWLRVLASVGYRPEAVRVDEDDVGEVFLCRRP